MDEPEDELRILVRKMWVCWLLLTAAGPVVAFGAILALANLNAAGDEFVSVIILTYLLGFVSICVVSVGLGRAIAEQKGMSKSRRILLEVALVIGGSLIGLVASVATCGVALMIQ